MFNISEKIDIDFVTRRKSLKIAIFCVLENERSDIAYGDENLDLILSICNTSVARFIIIHTRRVLNLWEP